MAIRNLRYDPVVGVGQTAPRYYGEVMSMLRDGTSTPQADAADTGVASTSMAGRTSDNISRAMLRVQPLSPEGELEVAKAEAVLARHVCGLVNEALTALNLDAPSVYGEEAQAQLRQAWAIAALLRSQSVSPFHMIAALTAANQKWADELSALVRAEPAWLLAGALVRPAVLDMAAGPQPLARIAPHPTLLEWLAEAGAHARRERPDHPELRPEDMIAVLASRADTVSISRKLKRLLLQAARVGRAPAELVKTRQGVGNVGMTLGYFKAATERGLKDVDQNLATVAESLRELPDRAALTQAITRMTAAVRDVSAEHRAVLEGVDTRLSAIDDRLALRPADTAGVDLAPVTQAVGKVGDRLRGALDGSETRQSALLARIDKKLPSAPPTGWLIFAVLGALATGISAGFVLAPI